MKRAWIYPVLLVSVAVLAALSMMAGRVWTPLSAWFDQSDPRWPILFELRAPRTALALLVGGALGMAGAAMQGYTRNALADPGVIGVSAMAALGAVLAIYFGVSALSPWVVPMAAIAFAVLGVLLLLALVGVTASPITFVLAGVIVQTVAGAAVSLAMSVSPNPWATQEIINWLMGSLADRSFEEVRLAAPFVVIGAFLMLGLGRALDALSLGEASAESLGVDLPRTQLQLAIGVSLATGACVAVTGIISFVGLIVPHILRPFVGATPSRLLVPSAIGGAVLVLAADILVRLTPAATEIKLGVALSALGGPFFLAMLVSMRRRMA